MAQGHRLKLIEDAEPAQGKQRWEINWCSRCGLLIMGQVGTLDLRVLIPSPSGPISTRELPLECGGRR